jgi:hypothetical protein
MSACSALLASAISSKIVSVEEARSIMDELLGQDYFWKPRERAIDRKGLEVPLLSAEFPIATALEIGMVTFPLPKEFIPRLSRNSAEIGWLQNPDYESVSGLAPSSRRSFSYEKPTENSEMRVFWDLMKHFNEVVLHAFPGRLLESSYGYAQIVHEQPEQLGVGRSWHVDTYFDKTWLADDQLLGPLIFTSEDALVLVIPLPVDIEALTYVELRDGRIVQSPPGSVGLFFPTLMRHSSNVRRRVDYAGFNRGFYRQGWTLRNVPERK